MTNANQDDEVIVCRCRDVTEGEIREAISEGFDTMELLKRKSKIGTGTCGGRTCLPHVRRILTEETEKAPEEVKLPRTRSPIIPVPVRFAAGEKTGEEK
ncbi:(2Fe-2S)-binding protein [Candidatus Bipolaricaulota bacterium]|nr:(2Fe-2S)-binding protein [Candidatus Bipolaricaulota bacterium]